LALEKATGLSWNSSFSLSEEVFCLDLKEAKNPTIVNILENIIYP
jgi:hypothetical protein